MASGGEILVDVLERHGVRHVFTVPGESFIAALDAMHDARTVQPVTCRHEGGAAMMAEATGKLLGWPGVALVTRGPGAANAVSGVYVAHQDATPMLLLVGLPPRRFQDLPAFQAIDIAAMFGGITKWVKIVQSAGELDDVLTRAFHAAMSGRAGPVVIGIPEDVFAEETAIAATLSVKRRERVSLHNRDLKRIAAELAIADRPIVVAGGSDWSEEAAQDLAIFAERFNLPVVTSFRRQDHFDNRHRCFVGHAGFAVDAQLAAGLKAADLVIAIGTRLGEVTTQGFSLLQGGGAEQKLIHIAPDAADALSPVNATLAMAATAPEAARQLSELALPDRPVSWATWRRDLRAAYDASLRPQTTPGDVKLEAVITALSERLPEEAIVCNGAGNYAAFLHRYFVYKQYGTELAPVSGTMGYGLPAAIAAKLRFPERTVVALAGDGCLQMTGQELATAVQLGLNVIVIVANNGTLGTIRMHQERRYPGRVTATGLHNPDFAAWAESFGAIGERVTSTDEFLPALERALEASCATVIELMLDADAVSVRETITSIRASASNRNTP